MNKNVNEYWNSSDLALVATVSLWFPIDCIEKLNGKISFNFLRNNELDELVENYWRKELRVEPQAFFSQLKFLKTRIHEEARQ